MVLSFEDRGIYVLSRFSVLSVALGGQREVFRIFVIDPDRGAPP